MKLFPFLLKVIILALLLLSKYFPYLENHIESRNLSVTVNFIIFLFTANLAYSLTRTIYKKRKEMGPKEVDNILSGGRNIYYLTLGFGFVAFLLSLAGINFGTLFTTLSIVAAAIAIVTKEYISPIIAGFHIALTKNLNINDYVKIGELKGKIVDLQLTKLKLLSDDDDLIIISNEKAYFNDVVNYTKGNARKVNINFILGSDFEGTVDDLEKNLIDEILEFSTEIEKDSYNLKVMEILKDSISFKFQYELKKQDDRNLEKIIRKKTIRKVVNHIKSNK